MKVLSNPDSIITRTLKTAVLIDGFWDRWIVHGVESEDINQIRRSRLKTVEDWIQGWNSLARNKEQRASELMRQGRNQEAEYGYRLASLYYNLIYWIYPENSMEKEKWYMECLASFRIADSISPIKTQYAEFEADGQRYKGRIRIPENPAGCIIIVNPIDSSKEELFLYENDFAQAGFMTISFDGPGQGENYAFTGYRATSKRWARFMDALIEFSVGYCPHLPLFTFGTSLGASWSIYASCHPKILKAVAVSPAVAFSKLNLPGYFLEKMDNCCYLNDAPVPEFEKLSYRSPVWVFHGRDDFMVTTEDMYELYNLMPAGKWITEYDGEGHCCNHKLSTIRDMALHWFAKEIKGRE